MRAKAHHGIPESGSAERSKEQDNPKHGETSKRCLGQCRAADKDNGSRWSRRPTVEQLDEGTWQARRALQWVQVRIEADPHPHSRRAMLTWTHPQAAPQDSYCPVTSSLVRGTEMCGLGNDERLQHKNYLERRCTPERKMRPRWIK